MERHLRLFKYDENRKNQITDLLHKIEKVLHYIRILNSEGRGTVNFYNNAEASKRYWRTASIVPSTPRVFRVTCSNTPTTSRTMASTSWEGTPRRDTVYGAGGSSCIISMFASASQTAVSWRCAAPHTSSSRGAGGNESSVASAESAVIDLKRSLSAYRYLT
jgi:hypothetical protein